jgi:hypothetical protein
MIRYFAEREERVPKRQPFRRQTTKIPVSILELPTGNTQ